MNISSFKNELSNFYTDIRKLNSKQIQKKSFKDKGKKIVKRYFNEIRPKILSQTIERNYFNTLDFQFQNLLSLTNANSLRSKYLSIVKTIRKELDQVEARIITSGQINQTSRAEFSDFEKSVLFTLEKLPCPADLSYKQALLDIRDNSRISYKGTANEMRETLREVLSYLAPDEKVKSQEGFTFEKGADKPTQKQKISFILSQRNISKAYKKAPAEAVEIIENKGNFTRAVYNRASMSVHGQYTREEIMRLKKYLDIVLSELLELPESL